MTDNSELSALRAKYSYLDQFYILDSITGVKGDGTKNLAFTCKLCGNGKMISAASMSIANLKRHIERLHKAHYEQYTAVLSGSKGSKRPTNLPLQSPAKQSRLDSFMPSSPNFTTHVSQASLDTLVLKYLINNSLPLKTVESEDFQKLVLAGRTGKKVMSYNTLKLRIDSAYTNMLGIVKDKLSGVKKVCLTCDLWTAGTRSFLGVTCHWLNPDMTRESAALALRRVKGTHSFDVLANHIEAIQKEFGLQNKTDGCVTDSASNFMKAFKLFQVQESDKAETEDSDDSDDEISGENLFDILNEGVDEPLFRLPPHIRCSAHILNLISTTDILKYADKSYLKASKVTYAKCQVIFAKSKKSSKFAESIKEKTGGALYSPTTTRWSSTFLALSRLQELINKTDDNFDSILDGAGLNRFTSSDLLFIKEYVQIMSHTTKALNIIQGEKNAFIGYLLPVLNILMVKMNEEKPSKRICGSLCDAVIKGIKTRFESHFKDEKLVMASLIIPKFKTNWMSSEHEKNQAWDMFRRELNTVYHELSLNEKRMANKEKNTHRDDDYDGFFPPIHGYCSTVDEICHRYQSSHFSHVSDLAEFDLLRNVFIKFNTNIMSSAAVERLFSRAGGIFTKKRQNLSDQRFEKILLLKINGFD